MCASTQNLHTPSLTIGYSLVSNLVHPLFLFFGLESSLFLAVVELEYSKPRWQRDTLVDVHLLTVNILSRLCPTIQSFSKKSESWKRHSLLCCYHFSSFYLACIFSNRLPPVIIPRSPYYCNTNKIYRL